MRIVHVANHFMPDRGYTEYYLAKYQTKMGHQVCIITSENYSCISKTKYKRAGAFLEDGVKIFRLPTSIQWSGYPFVSFKQFRDCLLTFHPQIVHVHGAMSPMAFATALYKNKMGYKIVADIITGMVIANGLSLILKKTLSKLYSRLIWPYLTQSIDCIFACSEAAINWMQSELGVDSSKVKFVPLGADNELFKSTAGKKAMMRKQLMINDKDVVAIYTGKLLPYKRIDDLLTASALIMAKKPHFKLLLVGEGPQDYVTHLKMRIAELGITPNVLFHNAVHRTELPAFYATADFAVWPGHHSVSMIEAMSTGLPIIIPRSKWTNHLLRYNNGFSYVEGNVSDLQKKVGFFLEHPKLRKEMGYRSHELVEEVLSWNFIAKQYTRIYDSVIKGSDCS